MLAQWHPQPQQAFPSGAPILCPNSAQFLAERNFRQLKPRMNKISSKIRGFFPISGPGRYLGQTAFPVVFQHFFHTNLFSERAISKGFQGHGWALEQAPEENNHREPGKSLGASLRFSLAGMRGQNGAGTGTGDTGQGQGPCSKALMNSTRSPAHLHVGSLWKLGYPSGVMALLICNPADGELSPSFQQLGL